MLLFVTTYVAYLLYSQYWYTFVLVSVSEGHKFHWTVHQGDTAAKKLKKRLLVCVF